jgi:phospholipid transport system substrate-binding protein
MRYTLSSTTSSATTRPSDGAPAALARGLRRAGVALALLFVAAATAVAPRAAHAQDAEAQIRQMLDERDREIKAILDGGTDDLGADERERLKTLINGMVDFRAMGRQALGPFWSDLTETQQDEFVDVFRTIVRAQSLSDLEVYNSAVTYDAIAVEGDSAFVRTTTTYEGTQTPVEYDLERLDAPAEDADFNWVAEDIIVDGVSTAESYARSFQSVMRKRGFDTLMKSLRKKRDKVLSADASTGRPTP